MLSQSTPADSATFDPALCFLGLLCVRRHEWQGTGLSLRYLSTRQCIACLRESVRIGRERPDYHLSDAEFTLLLSRLDVRLRVHAQLWGNLSGEEATECWIWQGHTVHGYGNITIRLRGRTKSMRAHRLAFLLAHGSLPPHPLVIRHIVCDNPLCCNPAHLAAGTTAENVADKVAHNRQARGPRAHPEWAARGERHGHARWTEAQVEEMRRQRASGQTLAAIAATFGTTRTKVQEIVTGQNWRHVGGPLTPVGSKELRGENMASARLTETQVREILALHAEGKTRWELAQRYGVGARHIYDILTGQLWAHVDGPRVYNRQPKGRKLNAEKVRRIWAMYADGIGPTPIAEAMDVSLQCIRLILARQTWKKYAPDAQISRARRSTSETP